MVSMEEPEIFEKMGFKINWKSLNANQKKQCVYTLGLDDGLPVWIYGSKY